MRTNRSPSQSRVGLLCLEQGRYVGVPAMRVLLRWLAVLVMFFSQTTAWGFQLEPIATALDREGRRIAVRLAVPSAGALRVEAQDGRPIRFDDLQAVGFPGPGGRAGAGPAVESAPSFRLELGGGQGVSGNLIELDESQIRFAVGEGPSRQNLSFDRSGVTAVTQRAGEVLVLADDFDSMDRGRWETEGAAEVVELSGLPGEKGLRIASGMSSVRHKLETPLGSGRIEFFFLWQPVEKTGDRAEFVMSFEGEHGREAIRVILGWGEAFPGVQVDDRAALVVQPLVLTPGWHRLGMRFRADRTMVAVDGDILATGSGPSGPLTEFAWTAVDSGRTGTEGGQSLQVDQLRVARYIEPPLTPEIDPGQDEVRLAVGDQIWGKILSADAGAVWLEVDGTRVSIPWAEVAGLYFRRQAKASRPLDGQFLLVEWEPRGGQGEIDRLEGAFVSLEKEGLNMETSYGGLVRIPPDRLRRLVPLGRGRRIVLDAHSRHLGDQFMPDLDPPQPDSDEMSLRFTLTGQPALGARIAFVVVDVEGEYEGGRFFEEIRGGHLLTEVYLNNQKIGTLNSQIRAANTTPERISLPISPGFLREGENHLLLRQVGRSDAPTFRDDLGVSGIFLEWPSGIR